MKPLIAVVVYNRLDETVKTLISFVYSTRAAEIVIVDNGSDAAVKSWLYSWQRDNRNVRLLDLPENIGCPRALNLALAYRQPGQPFVKIDNDVLLAQGDHWLADIAELAESAGPVAMISAYYEPWQQQRVTGQTTYQDHALYHIQPVVGHCVWHTGAFMDRVGYFDVLAPDHLYGFEDLLLSHKATCLGWQMLAWAGWRIENIQRQSAIGTRAQRDAHVEEMRPLYNLRVRQLTRDTLYTGPEGLLQ